MLSYRSTGVGKDAACGESCSFRLEKGCSG